MEKATAISLFTGCGGSDAGLASAGFRVIFANDILDYAREVYLANFSQTDYLVRDVSVIRAFPQADLLVGCYPCQGFSIGGARDPKRNVNYLYREFDRALRAVKPKAFIVENVAGMARTGFQHLLRAQVVRFRSAGYRVRFSVLDARKFGVPQERRRLFIVGLRSDISADIRFPEPTHRLPGESGSLPLCPTIRDAIGHLPEWPSGDFDEQPFHWYYLSRDRYRGWDTQSQTVVANSRHTPLHPMSPQLKKIEADHWMFADNRPARRFSVHEIAMLQGFSRGFVVPNDANLRTKYRVIGNAVPPPLFAAVANALPDVW